MRNAHILISDTSVTQIDAILNRLQFSAPANYEIDDRRAILQCSTIFLRSLSRFEFDSIYANFDIKGKFIDFETTDGAVSGIFPCKSGKNVILYPCSVC